MANRIGPLVALSLLCACPNKPQEKATPAPAPNKQEPKPSSVAATAPTSTTAATTPTPAPTNPTWRWAGITQQGEGQPANSLWGVSTDELFWVGDEGTIFRSTDGGKTHTAQTSGTKNNLTDIWGSGPELYAVGKNGTILHSTNNGEGWSKQESSVTNSLLSTWGSGPTDVYAVGERGTILHTTDSGKTWEVQKSGAEAELREVWGSGPTDVYAVGDDGTILHTADSGKTWQDLSKNLAPGVEPEAESGGGDPLNGLFAVWGSGPNDVYAGGENGWLLHSIDQGKQWTRIKVKGWPEQEEWPDMYNTPITCIWGAGATDLYLLGPATSLHSADGGKTWKKSIPAGPTSLWGASPESLYGLQSGVLVHLNGKSWEPTAPAVTTPNFESNAVWGSGPNDVYLVGGETLYHSADQGKTWQSVQAIAEYGDLWGSGPNDVYIAETKNLLHSTDGGKTWSASSIPESMQSRMWGSGPDDIYLVGGIITNTKDTVHGGSPMIGETKGRIYHSANQGKSWELLVENQWMPFSSVWGSGPDEVYVIDGKNKVSHSADKGKTWEEQAVGISAFTIWGSGPDDVYAVGTDGIAHTTDKGKTWTKQTAPIKNISDIWGSGPDDVYAVGEKGVLLHTVDGGKTWEQQEQLTTQNLTGVWGSGPNDVYVFGEKGIIFHHP